jgi:DNA polymerase-3 subunit gamma/tau
MYQALYRKWRPQTFDQVVGQEHITETLKNQVRNDRLSHAYIFIGTRGTGKTTCARILAKAVNCEHPVDGNPCGQCPACRGISEGTIMDVVELDAASNNGVDNVRALREEAVFSPSAVRKRVYIIDEVHMLSTPAFNALLKILEEPPAHLMFILATTELQKVPATILSRCQRHSFRRIDTPRIAAYLEKIAGAEHFDLSHDAAELIARLADGGVRDALSLLDQCSVAEKIDVDAVYATMGLAGNRRIARMLDLILKHDTAAVLKEFAGMWMDGKDPATLLGELNGLLRDTLMLRVAPKAAMELASGSYDRATLAYFSQRMTAEELIAAMDTLQRAVTGLRDSGNPKTAAELCLVSLCSDAGGDGVSGLRARISRLEEELARGIPVRQPEYEDEYPDIPEEERPAPIEDELPDPGEYEPDERAPAPTDVESEPAEGTTVREKDPELDWKELSEAVKPRLPLDLRFSLDDESVVRARTSGDLLQLFVQPGFKLERFKRQEVLESIAQEASRLTGREIRVQIGELNGEPRPLRSLDELKGFKEVHYK